MIIRIGWIFSALCLAQVAGALPPLPEGARLRELGEARGVWIGAALKDNFTPAGMGSAAYDAYALVAAREFDFFTPENQDKFRFVHPAAGVFTFATADLYDQFAASTGAWMHGHPMVWYKASNLPDFVLAAAMRAELLAIMEEHIDALGARWGERMRAWDVVNEAITDGLIASPATWRQGLRSADTDLWRRVIGDDYVELAFRHAAAVRAREGLAYELLYNDYNTETLTPKSDAQYLLVQDLVARGVPIDGVGLQMHIASRQPDAVQFRANLKRLSDLGLSLYLTELDSETSGDALGLARQANTYHRLFDVALRNPHLRAIQTWGVTDRYSWKPASECPLLFNAPASGNDFAAKPAYYALQDALAHERRDAVVSGGGFEAGTADWFGFSNPALQLVTVDDAHSGAKALRVSGRTRDFEGPGQDVLTRLAADGAGAGRYELAGWFRVPSGPAGVRLTLRVNDAHGVRRYYSVEGMAGASWARVAGWINLTWFKNLTEAVLYAETSGGTADFLLDDVSLGDGNLLANGSMETGGGWSPLGPCVLTPGTAETGRHYGATGLGVTARAAAWQGPGQDILAQLLATGPGTYRIQGYVNPAEAGVEAKLTVRLSDGASQVHQGVRRAAVQGVWTRVSGDVVLAWDHPPSAALMYVETAAGTSALAVDDLLLRKVAEPAVTPFAAWQALYFSEAERQAGTLSAAGVDADGDGLANLVEYALGSDPRGAAGRPTLPFPFLLGADGRLEFEVRRVVDPGVTLAVETSEDLVAWTAAALEVETTPEPDGAFVRLLFRESGGATPGARRFYRLRFGLAASP